MEGNDIFASLVLGMVFIIIVRRSFSLIKNEARKNFISLYEFPGYLPDKIVRTYPHLSQKDVQLVLKALKEYFKICSTAKMKMVSMPSKVVDLAWHEFILFTREYEKFCRQGFGKFLHHTPAKAMPPNSLAKKSLKRAWYIACQQENISPESPVKIPLLFTIDSDLNISDGIRFDFAENIDLFSEKKRNLVYSVENIDCLGDGGNCGGDGGGSGCGGGGCGGGGGS